MIELGVNIDHVATIRQARLTWEPDPVEAAREAHFGGAEGVTVHLREDRRHIQDEDVRRIRLELDVKLNFEMAATDEMVAFACQIKPEMAMLVPEGRLEITTEGGLDVDGNRSHVTATVNRLRDAGIRVSVFIDPEPRQVDAARDCGVRYAKSIPALMPGSSISMVGNLPIPNSGMHWLQSRTPAEGFGMVAWISMPAMRSITRTFNWWPHCLV